MYYIGIDGGGSKTAVRITNKNKFPLADVVALGCNPSYIGVEPALDIIETAVKEVCIKAGVEFSEVSAVFGGIAGCVTHNFSPECKERLGKLLPNARIDIVNDSMLLFVNFTGNEGAVMICGTGSICFVLKDGSLSRVGGYGTLDGGGSGYEIGKAAISYALKAADGRREKTILTQLIDEDDKRGIVAVASAMSLDEIRGIGKYAPLVFKAHEMGDKVATAILEDCFEFLAEYVEVASKKFDGPFELVLGGGIFKVPESVEMFKKKCSSQIIPIVAGEPVDCAIRSAIDGNPAIKILG